MNRICTRCGLEKPIDEFYQNRIGYKDGIFPWCKKCYREHSRKQKKDHPEWIEKRKKQRQTPWGKFLNVQRAKKYNKNHPDQQRARNAILNEIRQKRMLPAKNFICAICNKNQAYHYHHWHGYSEGHKLDVIPVCIKCHNFEHPKSRRD